MAENPFEGLSPQEIVDRLNAWQASTGQAPGGPPAVPATAPGMPSSEDILARLGNQPSPSISAPATQQWILAQAKPGTPRDPDAPTAVAPPGYAWFKNPGYTAPKVTAPADKPAYGSADTGWYIQDPTSPNGVKLIVPAKTPNADEEIKKALEREQAEQLRNQRVKNEAAGFGYADDDTVAKRSLEARAANLDEKKYAQSKAQDDEKIRQFDIDRAAKDKTDAASIGLTTAQTSRTGAETAQIQQNVDIARARLPTQLEQDKATLAGTNASTAATLQSTQIAGAPKVQTPGTGMYNWTYDPKTGQMSQAGVNLEYQAKTQAEVAARVGQLQSLMQQKQAEVQQKVDSKAITAEQGLQEFNRWYDQNITPQQGALQAAQQAAQFAQAKDQAEMQRAALQTALGAGTQQINAFNAEAANRVGPGFQQAMNQIGAGQGKNVDLGAAIGYKAPSVTQTANDAVNEALKHISPGAAAATGMPMPSFNAIDINQQLSNMPFVSRFGGGAPPPPPGMGAAPAPAAPAAVPPGAGPMFSSGTMGEGNPWATGTPAAGTVWQNPALFGQYTPRF